MNKRKKKSKKWIILIIILVVVVGGFWACSKAISNVETNLVETVSPTIGDIEEIVSVTGVTESEEVKRFFAPVSGTVSEVCVSLGDTVKKGTVLMKYDMAMMDKILEQARLQYVSGNSTYKETLQNNKEAIADLKEANTNIPVLEQQIKDETAFVKNIQKSLENMQVNNANSLTTQNYNLQKQLAILQENPVENADKIKEIQQAIQNNQYVAQLLGVPDDQKKLQGELEVEQERLAGYQEYKAEMEAQKRTAEASILSEYQKEGLEASEQLNLMSYESVQEDYELAKEGVVAEFDGVVTELSVIEGMSVGESMQLLTLANTDDVMISFTVGKYDLTKIAVGQKADIEINGHKYTGSISKINRMAQNSSNGVFVGAQIRIDNPDENIILGLDAKIKIYAQEAKSVLLIPVVALNADKNGDYVYVIEDGIAVRKDIVTGISNVEFTEVKEGLSENDVVITSCIFGLLEEGAPVTDMSNIMTE